MNLTPASPPSIEFYRCFDATNSFCSLGDPNLLAIEEMGWEIPWASHFQERINLIGWKMGKRMELGRGLGRCVLVIKERVFRQLNGCMKISGELCDFLQGYLLNSWKALARGCHSALKGLSEVKTASEACRGVTLTVLDSPPIPPLKESFQEMIERGAVWFSEQAPEGFRGGPIRHLFSEALRRQVPVTGGPPSCTEEEGLELEREPLFPQRVCSLSSMMHAAS